MRVGLAGYVVAPFNIVIQTSLIQAAPAGRPIAIAGWLSDDMEE